MADSDGDIFPFGDAGFFGAPTHTTKPVVGMAKTTDGMGYWLVTDTGHVYHYGDAGALCSAKTKAVIVGIATTPDAAGYWLAAANGKTSPFGDA